MLCLLGASVMLWACNTNPNAADGSESDTTQVMENETVVAEAENDAPETYERGSLKIYPAPASPEYADAKLMRIKPEDMANVAKGAVKFDFKVENYDLGMQTPDAADKGLANSDKGQHIHLIVDNSPYSAHYMPGLEKEFEMGNHYAIAFLSRSYHESVKNPNAFQVFQFSTGTQGKDMDKPYDLTQPMLFYSRPKGDYKGADTKKVLFDFYLSNAELAPDGMSVMLTINDSLDFEFDKWQPYIVEGLPMGENTFTIKLTNAQGTVVNSEVNVIERKFTLSE